MFDFENFSGGKIVVREIRSSNFTPISVLNALHIEALLESAYTQTGKGRYSLLVLESAFSLIKDNGKYFLNSKDSKQNINLSKIDKSKKYLDWIELFRRGASKIECELDFPLPLGGIGYLGYEFFSEIESVKFSKPKLIGMPECCFIFGRDFLIFDHLYDNAYLCCVKYPCECIEIDLDSRIECLEREILNLVPKKIKAKKYEFEILSKDKKEWYEKGVEQLKSEIYQGNLLQCVLSQSMQIRTDLPPIEAYINLRHANPSPYMFYFNFGDFVLFGASPEIMVKLQDSKLTLKPIAGTKPRGKSVAEDLALENELLGDEKENAEHLMLLDLGRNDLGKVSIPGSVEVLENRVIEKYSKVMHIVSKVESSLDSKLDFRDVIYATFPAGTISGAPKIAAIKALEDLEQHSREFYAGAVGYIDKNGNLDSAITIRSAIYKNGIYYLQAGAGVVYQSHCKMEFIETQNKMQALIECILGDNKNTDSTHKGAK